MMNQQSKDSIIQAYKDFNARNIDAVLQLMDEEVCWPNGWEGGYVEGHEEVRDYWTRQWKEINPNVKPVSFNQRENGDIEVKVRQIVKNMEGNILVDEMVNHVYTFENGLIKKMDIEKL
jgi:hypothetical protein